MTLQSFYGELDKSLVSVNAARPSFLNDFRLYKMNNGNAFNDDHITGKISFVSDTKFIDLVNKGITGNCIDILVEEIKKQAAAVLQYFYSSKGDTTFDGKNESEIVRMIENHEVGDEYAENYRKALNTNLTNHEFRALADMFFKLDWKNATIELAVRAYSPSNSIYQRLLRFEKTYVFDYDEDIAGRITGIMQDIFKEILK